MSKTKSSRKKKKKLKSKTVYLVTYNDTFGNGDEDCVEAVLTKQSDFSKWLKKNNEDRGAIKPTGNEEEDEENEANADAIWETEEEFDINPVTMYFWE